MSDNIKLVIEIPKELYENKKGYLTNMDAYMICKAVQNGTPLDDVKEQMKKARCFHIGTFEGDNPIDYGIVEGFDKAIAILDNIVKAEHNDGLICTECECKDECDGIEYMSKDQCEKKRGWQ